MAEIVRTLATALMGAQRKPDLGGRRPRTPSGTRVVMFRAAARGPKTVRVGYGGRRR